MKTFNLIVVAPGTVDTAVFPFTSEDEATDIQLKFIGANYITWIKVTDDTESLDLQ